MDEAMKAALANAQNYCDEFDKSTEFMIQFMCDAAQTADPSLEFLDAHEIVMEYVIMTTKHKPRLKDIPTSQGKHSAMQAWANLHQWRVCVITAKFNDGSKGVFEYEQATKEVEYKVEGETYSVTVPLYTKFKYGTKTEDLILGPTAILEADTKFMGKDLAFIEVSCRDQ